MTNTSRQFGYAIVITAALHAVLIVIVSLWLFYWFLRSLPFFPPENPATTADESLSVVIDHDVAPPVVIPEALEPVVTPKNLPSVRFIRTNANDPSATPPEPGTAAFISDRNTKGASEAEPDPNGDKNLPSMKGEDLPVLDLANRAFAEGEHSQEGRITTGIASEASPYTPPKPPQDLVKIVQAAAQKRAEQKQQQAAKEDPASPTIDPTSDLTTQAPPDRPKVPAMKAPTLDKLYPEERKAELAQEEKPPPPPRANIASTGTAGDPKGKDPKAAQTQTRQNAVRGGITNRGKAAVDAADTPLGRYMSKLNTAVSQKFTPACKRAQDRVTYGAVQVEFDINLKGGVENLRIAGGGSGNAILQDLVLGVVLESKLPPLPDDLEDYLIGNRLHITYGFLFH